MGLLCYAVAGAIVRKLDQMDLRRASVVPLCGKDALYKYEIQVKTGWAYGAGEMQIIAGRTLRLDWSDRHLCLRGAVKVREFRGKKPVVYYQQCSEAQWTQHEWNVCAIKTA